MEGLPNSVWRDAPPIHFRFDIESFSTLSTHWLKRYESCEFEAGGYSWNLALYPNGNKEGEGKDHISVYLVLAEANRSMFDEEILVSFALLLFNHVKKKYFTVPVVSRFGSEKYESGFDKFVPLKIFNEPSSGYLVNDSCLLGADVSVVESSPKVQSLSMMMLKPPPVKHTWKVQKFSGLEDKAYYSEKFTARGHDWKIELYPKGCVTGEGNLTLCLTLADPETYLSGGRQVLVNYTLRVVDQVNKIDKTVTDSYYFSELNKSWGWDILQLKDLNQSTGYLVNDTCILEAEVVVLGSAKSSG